MGPVWRYTFSWPVTMPIVDTSPSVIMQGALESQIRSTGREVTEGLAKEYFEAMRDGNVEKANYCLDLKMVMQGVVVEVLG